MLVTALTKPVLVKGVCYGVGALVEALPFLLLVGVVSLFLGRPLQKPAPWFTLFANEYLEVVEL